ncbi:Cytosolic sulfotransferase 10, partial [Bienertia sinuspersici]
MEGNKHKSNPSQTQSDEEIYDKEEEIKRLMQCLPMTTIRGLKSKLIMYENFWYMIDQPLFILLLTHHPQELVYNLESDIYSKSFVYPHPNNLNDFHHLDFLAVICLIHHFLNLLRLLSETNEYDQDSLTLPRVEDFFEDFCEGKVTYGPFFEHALEYWKISLDQPYK